jgi:hypothetical protein
MTAALAGYLVGALCYGLSTAYGIRFSSDLTVPTAAALGPAVAWSGLSLARHESSLLLAIGPLVAVVVHLVRRRSYWEVTSHTGLFLVSVLVFLGFRRVGLEDLLVPALISGVAYLIGEFTRQRAPRARRRHFADGDVRTWLMLQAVLVCACGLTMLGLRQMDWPAFVAMAAVLALTKHEFEAFALSRTAYEQTLSAVEELKSRGRQISSLEAQGGFTNPT